MIKISIVIPTYNRPQSLDTCCASIVSEVAGDRTGVRKGTGIEIIIVDDGSAATDAEKNHRVCEKYGAVYCLNIRNSGMAVARNRGIAVARGAWIVFLDDDVTCDRGWYPALVHTIQTIGDDVAAFEGRVNPSGNGVWDREVQNRSGGAYLTCHFGVRRSIIDACGMFDVGFAATGPYCEDHEFAARLMTRGAISFIGSLSVTHAPRSVNLWRYIVRAPGRCRQLLLSDCYFYHHHPDRYRLFRSHRDFFGTYRSYLVRNVVNNLRRRKLLTLVSHPLQTGALIAASVVEQCTAWLLMTSIIRFSQKLSSPVQRPDASDNKFPAVTNTPGKT
jgi:glycosyltransferase involved in cell wall biosynthesis